VERFSAIATQLVAAPSHGSTVGDVRVLPPKGLNTSSYLDLNRFSQHTAWAHGFMHAYALWLGPVLLAAIFVATYAVAWWRRATRAAALLVLGGIGTVIALAINQPISHAAKELRPYATHPHVLVLVGKASDYAFPSDHSVIAGGLTASLLLVLGARLWRPRVGGAAAGPRQGQSTTPPGIRVLAAVNVVLGLFLCFARVYVGAHYPGDVVAGYLLSSLVVLACSLLRPVASWVTDSLDTTVLAVLLRRPVHRLTGGGGGGAAAAGSALER
jgi:membrane-associated phospholipid phosphatase